MKTVGLFYGSTTGNTQSIAESIAKELGVSPDSVHDVSNINEDMISKCDVMLLGSSTWGDGELQDDWYSGLEKLKKANLSGKTVALFGCGDSVSYCDTFCDALGEIYTQLESSGCTFCGFCKKEDYDFCSSKALINDQLVGLLIDEDNESDKTSRRITDWVNSLKETCLK